MISVSPARHLRSYCMSVQDIVGSASGASGILLISNCETSEGSWVMETHGYLGGEGNILSTSLSHSFQALAGRGRAA
jgi:hypothetical protein